MTSQILATEFSEKFIQGMKDRMVVSYYKYGPVKDGFPHKVNALETLQKRLEQYQITGNTEFLMDVANYAMIEFMFPSHYKAHFKPTDSNESPGRFARDATKEMTPEGNQDLSDEEWREMQARRAEVTQEQ
jgi:adenylate kinase family enzyme